MKQKYGNEFKLINIWNDIIKTDLNDNIMKHINSQNKYNLKHFIIKFEERYILNDNIYKWNVAEYPMTSTCNLESLNRSMTAVIGTHPSLSKFCMEINKIIEKAAYKFELYVMHGTMDIRRKDSRVTLIERDVCFDDSKSIKEYVYRLAALQYRNSNLTKTDLTNTELNLLYYESSSDNENDNNSNNNHSNNNNNHNTSNHSDNNSNHSNNNNNHNNDNNSNHSDNNSNHSDNESNHDNNNSSRHNNNRNTKAKKKSKTKRKSNRKSKKNSDDDSTSDYKP